MKYRSAFCTLDAALRQLAMGNSKTADYNLNSNIDALIATIDANNLMRIKQLIWQVSEEIYELVDRVGIPYQDTWTLRRYEYRKFWQYDAVIGAYILRVPDDLLSITSLTINGTSYTENTDYYTRLDDYPKCELAIPTDTSVTLPSELDETIALVGIWGYHNNPDNMWIDSTDSVQDGGGINASVTSITVTDADGNNGYGLKRFETLQYIKIDDEFMQITAINTTTNVLTVLRGVNGTTAASHDNAATIYTFRPNDVFEEATRRRVVYLYLNPSETRRVVPLPDGTVQLDNDDAIPLPQKRYFMGSA